LKIARFKAMLHRVAHALHMYNTCIDVKLGFSDLADFATTQSPIDCELP
jgi:hypothetical protein